MGDMNKLILWDIDGTLIDSGGVAGEAMRAAMERVYGGASTEARLSYAGKTDRQIILETFAGRGHDELVSTLDHFTATYIEELTGRRDAFLARCCVLDGAVAVLERLTTADVVQSVLTGNLQPIARIKLDLMGLSRFLDLESGAYGSDHHRRTELAPIAAARAKQRYGRAFTGADVVVIGDTPHDIECGRAAGARTIAVATGPFSADALRGHGADIVLDNLADTDRVVESIFGKGLL